MPSSAPRSVATAPSPLASMLYSVRITTLMLAVPSAQGGAGSAAKPL